jgi:hypothetical protein
MQSNLPGRQTVVVHVQLQTQQLIVLLQNPHFKAISVCIWSSGPSVPCEVIADLPGCRPCNSSSSGAVDDGVDVVRVAAVCPSRALPLDKVIADGGIPLPGLFPLSHRSYSSVQNIESGPCKNAVLAADIHD